MNSTADRSRNVQNQVQARAGGIVGKATGFEAGGHGFDS